MATTEGTDALAGPKHDVAVRRALLAAGCKGERVVMPDPGDDPHIHAMTLVMADALHRAGLNVGLMSAD